MASGMRTQTKLEDRNQWRSLDGGMEIRARESNTAPKPMDAMNEADSLRRDISIPGDPPKSSIENLQLDQSRWRLG